VLCTQQSNRYKKSKDFSRDFKDVSCANYSRIKMICMKYKIYHETDLFTGEVLCKVWLLRDLLLLQLPLRHFDVVKSVTGKAAQHLVRILCSQHNGTSSKYVNYNEISLFYSASAFVAVPSIQLIAILLAECSLCRHTNVSVTIAHATSTATVRWTNSAPL